MDQSVKLQRLSMQATIQKNRHGMSQHLAHKTIGQMPAGSKVEINVQQGRLIVIPQKKKRYKLSELLAQCDPSLLLPAEKQEWVDAPAVGLSSVYNG